MDLSWSATAIPATNGNIFLKSFDVEKYNTLSSKFTYANLPGVKNAGTFQIICENCDNTQFQKYEDPNSYIDPPSDLMLAQIALKNYLHLISKRMIENEVYCILRRPTAAGAVTNGS